MTKTHQYAIRLLILSTAVFLLAMIIVAISFYDGEYPAFYQYISHLGSNEHSSTATKWIFRGGMGICALSMLATFFMYTIDLYNLEKGKSPDRRRKRYYYFFSIMTFFCFICAIGVAMPTDVYPTVHMVGAIGFFFTYILLNILWQASRIDKKHKVRKSTPEEERTRRADTLIDWVWANIVFFTGLAMGLFLLLEKTFGIIFVPSLPIVLKKVVVVQIVISAFLLDENDL